MAVVKELRTAGDYWTEMVEPDYRACLNDLADLRAALHAATSLFHMHDWVWKTHEAAVRATFSFVDATRAMIRVHDGPSFANALEQQCPDFGRIRGIANAAKHLQLRPGDIRPVANAPSHAANTAVRATGFGEGGYGKGPYSGTARVMLEGPNGNHMEFSDVAKAVYDMWAGLRAKHGW